jgi:hypothetical protein
LRNYSARPTGFWPPGKYALLGLVAVIPGVGLSLTGEEAVDFFDEPVALYILRKQLLDSRIYDQEAVLIPKIGDINIW